MYFLLIFFMVFSLTRTKLHVVRSAIGDIEVWVFKFGHFGYDHLQRGQKMMGDNSVHIFF